MRADRTLAKKMENMIATSQNLRRQRAMRNFIAGFLQGYGFISFVLFMFLERRWTVLAPKVPNVNLGLIYQHNDHGSYTYFSSFQATTCALMFITSIPLAIAGSNVAPKRNLKCKVGKFSARWTYDGDDPTSIRWKAALVAAFLTPAMVFILGPHFIRMLNSIGVVMNLG